MQLSVIVPLHNEEGILDKFYETLSKVLVNKNYEIIFVDDGSSDNSLKILREISNKDKKVKIISFSRNFKKDPAMYAGLLNCSGDYSCIIDGDFQQDPLYILEMFEFLENNKEYDSVCMFQKKRKENIFKSSLTKFFYFTIDKLCDIKFVDGASDFRMFRRNMKDAIISLSEYSRFSKGIFSYVGFKTKYLPYEVLERTTGKTHYNFINCVRYAFDGFVGFTTKPLRLSTYIGIITSIVAFVYFIILVVKTLIIGIGIPGYASLMAIILFLGGLQMLCIGILGEYLAKTYLETKKRPIYIEKERINFDEKN